MIIPFFFKNRGLTIKPFIFVYDKTDKCLIEHEKVHLRQQRYWFPFNIPWLLRWLFDKEFRHKVEKEALLVQLECMRKSGRVFRDKEGMIEFMVKTYYFSPEEARLLLAGM